MSEKRRVFITIKTYPTISKKYDELVCTAGILDDGKWVRIYPFPFRKLDYENRYKKYQWIELPLSKNSSDVRPESYKVDDITQIKLLGDPVGTGNGWEERKSIILGGNEVHSDLTELIARANANELSLAIFKPAKILDFLVEAVPREWADDKLKSLDSKAKQLSLFQSESEVRTEFLVVPKLPYKFSYRFADSKGRESTMMIEDWEIGALYWNCLKSCGGDEDAAIKLVRSKYLDGFSKLDLHLFLGTTKKFHGWATNPFVIVGVFYPSHVTQGSLF
jgi:hypothetical protein